MKSSGLLPPPSSKPSASLMDTQTLSLHRTPVALLLLQFIQLKKKKCFLILCIYLATLLTGPNCP